MENKILENNIKNWIATIAGVVDFVPLDEKNNINFENDGIIVKKNEKSNGINLTLGLVILINLNAKNIIEQIYEIVNWKLKELNLKITKLCVYIKGIK
ncbi:hypothetical protein [Metamycoplasma canadense]|uniref:hypothetical protein n=1 Tax=Metamycoplasma canadense TaxID=29554 RepID=UPI0005EF9FD2|nr:hypothetical protein [Metamycoplasma canadense]